MHVVKSIDIGMPSDERFGFTILDVSLKRIEDDQI